MSEIEEKVLNQIKHVRNIGISAHIDSGKTTLTERILFYTGKIHAIHEVRGKDGVGAKMDSMDLEREKGITIQSAATYCEWGDSMVNIIDTPGHVDFTVEVERALHVLDGAILVLDAVAGVQSQSITVDRQMRRYSIPRLAFINKMDRPGGNPYKVTKMLEDKLGHTTLLCQLPIGMEENFRGIIDLVQMRAYLFEGDHGEGRMEIPIPEEMEAEAVERRDQIIETCSDFDDEIAEGYLEGRHISVETLKRVIRKACIDLKATPVFIGSALKNKGVQLLLDAVVDYLPNPLDIHNHAFNERDETVSLSSDPGSPFVALAYKLEDGAYGQLTYMRVYQGTVRKGDFIENMSRGKRKLKVPRLIRMHSNELHDIDEARAGDIIAVFGIDCHSGDTFTDGSIQVTMSPMHVAAPVISVAVTPGNKKAEDFFSKAMNRFTKEDPTLKVHRDEESNETIMSGMGELHLEIYLERLRREYQCEVLVGAPQVAYREAITEKAAFNYVHKKQTGGRGQYAKVMGYAEPLPGDAIMNYEFVDDIKGGVIPREFISSCDKGFQEAMKKGSLIGFPIEKVRIVLNDGDFHAVDSSDNAFKTACLQAFRELYFKAKPLILEPMMKVEVQVPTDFQGSVIGSLNQRRGMILGTEANEGDDYITAVAEVPLAEMFGYATDLRSCTQGRGEFTMEFLRYSPVPKSISEELIAAARKKEGKGKAA